MRQTVSASATDSVNDDDDVVERQSLSARDVPVVAITRCGDAPLLATLVAGAALGRARDDDWIVWLASNDPPQDADAFCWALLSAQLVERGVSERWAFETAFGDCLSSWRKNMAL
jgi:hypothetical protein